MDNENLNDEHSLRGKIKRIIDLYDNIFYGFPKRSPKQTIERKKLAYFITILPNQKVIRYTNTKSLKYQNYSINEKGLTDLKAKVTSKNLKEQIDLFWLSISEYVNDLPKVFTLKEDRKRVQNIKARLKTQDRVYAKYYTTVSSVKKETDKIKSKKQTQLNLF